MLPVVTKYTACLTAIVPFTANVFRITKFYSIFYSVTFGFAFFFAWRGVM